MKSGKTILKIFSLIFSVLFLTGLRNAGLCQTVALPDTNFRNILLQKYPSVMSGNELDIAAANSFLFDLIIPNADISDLTGVEHFTSIYKLDAVGNNLTTLPDLSASTNLTYLYLSDNRIDNLDFMVNNTKLLQLHLFNNSLTSFPELPGFTNLRQLFLTGNQLDTLTGMAHLVNLTELQIGHNRFNALPDLSSNTRLVSLHFDQNNIKDLTQLESLPNLEIVMCWGNGITDLSALDSNTALKILFAFNNELEDLPVLDNKPGLTWVQVANNRLTFEDLLPLAGLGLMDFSYAPQDTVGTEASFSVRELNPLTLIVQADEGIASNIYTWYKDDAALNTNSTGNFSIQQAMPADSGIYHVEITNPALPDLTLNHRPWKVSVLPCMDLLSAGYKIVSKDCDEGTSLNMEVSTDGAQLPLSYTLASVTGGDSVYSPSGYIPDIPAGEYILYVTDQRNCRLQTDQHVTIYRKDGCDPVIVPSGNDHQSSYFIEGNGVARILDMNGNVIRELDAPAVWDGTKSDGAPAETGYYVITINDKKLTNITVLR